MSRLPVIPGWKCVKTLEKIGFYVKRREGSQVILRRDEPFCQVVVPQHHVLDKGTLRGILRQADVNIQDFLKVM